MPDNAVHGRGARLTFTLHFDHAVAVAGGSPELVLDVWNRAQRARLTTSASKRRNTQSLTFEWRVDKGDHDPDGIGIARLDLNGATIKFAAGCPQDGQGNDLPCVIDLPTFVSDHAKAYPEHRVRGGRYEIRLDVSGGADEGEPYTIRAQRNGGYEEPTYAVVEIVDSAFAGERTFSAVVEFKAGKSSDDGVKRTTATFTPEADGAAEAGRTLTLRLRTGVGNHVPACVFAGVDDDGYPVTCTQWYDTPRETGETDALGYPAPKRHVVTVTDAGIPADVPRLSVGPADVHEPETGTAPLRFRVCLWTGTLCPDAGRNDDFENYDGVTHEVTVDYATADGTATTRDGDYVATRGTLVFEPGETVKTVEVEVRADRHDEGTETVWLALSNPKGAGIARGRNFGQIHNTGPIPKAWIARFGRTVAEQVLDAVEGRMRAPGAAGTEVTLAGERIGGQAPDAEAGEDAAGEEEARRAAQREAGRLSDWLKGGTPGSWSGAGGTQEVREARSRAVTGRDLLTGSSFALAAETADKGLVSLWGRGAVTRFDGREGDLALDGEVLTGMLGADWSWGSGAGSWTAGLIVSHSTGEGGYSGAGAAEGSGDGSGSESRAGLSGRVEATLTGLFPWARHALTERLELWGAAGYGAGTLTVTPKNPGTGEDGAALRADLDLKMAAAGLRGTLLDGGADDLTLTAKTDAMVVQTASGRGKGADGGNLEPARATVTRLRLGLEGSRPVALGGGAVLTPRLEVGLRHDGGDAETGFGLDLGAALALSDPKRGLQAELRGRGLLSHESKGFRQRGFSGALAWKQKPGSDRGAALTLTQTVGGSSSGGADALLSRTTLDGLAANDNGSGDDLKSRRLELKLGYGLSAFGDRFTFTPEIGVGLSDTGRDYSLGWRLVRGGSGNGGSLELSFEARRRESANDNADPDHDVGLRLTARF